MVLLRKLNSKEGSTLAYLMFIIAILMMLGIAILTTTYGSYMLKINEAHSQTALYVNEAGLNEAYSYLGEEIENAAAYSKNVYIPAQLLNHPEINTQTLDEASYKAAIDGFFKKGYKSYFIMNEDLIKERLEVELINRPTIQYGNNGEVISSISARFLNNFSESVNNLQIEFTINVTKTDEYQQPTAATSGIRAVLDVGVPAYETPIAKQAAVIKKNALLDHALAANGNLYVSGGKVTIEGNGTFLGHDGRNEIQVPGESGGVIVGGQPVLWDEDLDAIGPIDLSEQSGAWNGELEVTGNLATQKYLRIAKSTELNPSTIHIEGNFHGNSIAVQGETNAGATIDIDGYASVFDDTEIESPKTTFNVDGSYYGFSTGSSGGTGVSVHDNSSSIVINNSDFAKSGDTSTITIRGQSGLSFPASAVTGVAPLPPDNGTYLAGTIYADEGKNFVLKASDGPVNGFVTVLANGTYLYKRLAGMTGAIVDSFKVDIYYEGDFVETKTVALSLDAAENKRFGYVQNSYQTGDSISVVGNYLAYSKVLDSTNPVNNGTDPVDSTYLDLDELIHFETFEPLFLVNKKKDSVDATQAVNMNYADKEKYSYFSQRQDSSDLNLGNSKIDLGVVVYSTGTVLGPSGMSHSVGDLSAQSLVLGYLADEYQYRTGHFGDPQHRDYIDDQANLVSGGVEAWLRTGSPNIMSDTDNELFYIQPDTDKKSIILKGLGDNALYDSLIAQLGADNYVTMNCGADVKGMVVSNKDIFVLGKVNYEGLLVAKGSIYCIGNEVKTFKNTNTSNPNNYVTAVAIDGINAEAGVAPKKIGYWFRQEENWKEVIVDNRYVAEVGGVYKGSTTAFDQLIKITSWQKIGR